MNNVYLITYSKNIENSEILIDRIKSVGDSFPIFENIYMVSTDLDIKGVYNKISSNGYEEDLILIVAVENNDYGYWGRMKVSLWKWLDSKRDEE